VSEHFRILEHTSDVGFEAFGSSREEAFSNAALALTSLIVDLETIALREPMVLTVTGADPESLLVNWLEEVLYHWDAEGWLLRYFTIEFCAEGELKACARGEKFDPERHAVKLLVKAVTYHQLVFEGGTHGWRAQVFVDI
jgi:SHS2 domain-containing protein